MKIYHSPKIEIEEIEAADIVLASSDGLGENETKPSQGGGRPRSVNGSIAGGSTVSNIIGSGTSNAFSAGDIFGNQ